MPKHSIKFPGLLLFGLFFLAANNISSIQARGLPAQEGIINFGKVSDTVFRGAQPDAAGIASLERLGVKTIVNLRMPDDVWKGEETEARAHGITYTNLPMRGVGRPTDEQVLAVLKVIETLPGPVFIHCRHGCDRTGTIVACYRITQDQWQGEKAGAEAVHYGMSWVERGMKRDVADCARTSTQLAKK